MKEIYWIDDNVSQLINYVQGIFTELWGTENDDGIASVIRLFGDGYKESENEKGWDEKSIKRLKEKIRNQLFQHCKNIEKWNWDGGMFEKKRNLIKKDPQLVKIDGNSVVCAWKNLVNREDYNEKKKQKLLGVEEILEELNIPEKAVVALDLVLLWNDRKKVANDIPIISMAIYDALKGKSCNCILYSNFTYDYSFITNWERIYKEINQKTTNTDVVIYSGRQMWEKAEKNNIIDVLKKSTEEGDKYAENESE